MGLEALTEIREYYEERTFSHKHMYPYLPLMRDFASICQHITEFGVGPEHDGLNSTVAWFYGLAGSEHNDKKLVCYDRFYNSHLKQIERLAPKVNVEFQFIEADSCEIEIEPTHILFIDTEHTYQCLTKELTLHADNVQGFIFIHDTSGKYEKWEDFPYDAERRGDLANSPEKYGMWPAVRDFLKGNARWRLYRRFEMTAGLTILVNDDIEFDR